ncbi:MAG TPA: alginate lyase family protein [Candidatus Atribacteria bacterium]|nr:alginate lyase family protein [Candidatus Atribacteria bacterium]
MLIKYLLEEIKLLGFTGTAFRIYYEFSLTSGLKKLKDNKIAIPKPDISFSKWKKNRKKIFLPDKKTAFNVLNTLLSEEEKKQIIKIANNALEGKILCFSKWQGNYGCPINWHYNPKKKVFWPKNVHWSKIMRYEKKCGDIKLTWEVNRFPHLYFIVRAYILTNYSKYVKAFKEQLLSWEKENPYPYGVNWYNGQELAIRMLAWIYALYMMADDPVFDQETFDRFLRLLYLHTIHIENNISYAYYAVHNNHLIGEALGLYISGLLFPYFLESKRWREKGKKILQSERCLRQFYEDGGYCQLSFNYQRLALHYYLWALRLAEVNQDIWERKENIMKIFDKSAKFLYSFMNSSNGQLPNWGANDGALLSPWISCDYADYRPIISFLSYITRKKRVFEKGPWDEELFWFFGKEAIESEIKPYKLSSRNFPITGLHVQRIKPDTFLLFRCGSVKDRFGQADQLHVDLWWKGINIAIDGGSYLYNDELQYHRYFVGTKSHNTVIVDNQDQMYLHRRFKWLYWTKAKLLSAFPLEGEHYGYRRLKGEVVHRRSINLLNENAFIIKDKLIVTEKIKHKYDLHWLLGDFHYYVDKLNNKVFLITLHTPKGNFYVKLECNINAEIIVNRARTDFFVPDGWQSRYYGEKIPALSVHVICCSKNGCEFTTLFTDKI